MFEAAALWASVYGWLTPTVLFLLLNLVIGTIAFSSSRVPAGNNPQLCRSPSLVFDRLRSFNLRFASPTTTIELQHTEPEPEPGPEPKLEEQHEQQHIARSQSDTKPTAGEVPEKLAKKMKKSATMKSVFNHFELEGEDIANDREIEKQRPATTREVSVREREEDAEVDAKADDFINRFKHQLKLQRLDSIIRYKEMLNRSH